MREDSKPYEGLNQYLEAPEQDKEDQDDTSNEEQEDNSQKTSDSLEADFQRWELDSELEELRKNI